MIMPSQFKIDQQDTISEEEENYVHEEDTPKEPK
jgi:hypothetical protein